MIFVTAYAEHAVRAFEAAAVDYVLKPVSAERLAKSLARLQERPAAHAGGHPQAAPGRYPAKAGDGHVFLELRRTSHFEVEDEIVWAWCGGSRFRTGWSTLAEVEHAFPAGGLLRIQRHLLLRPDAVLGLRPLEGGRATVRVAEGLELETSRTATPKLKDLLGL